MLSFSISNFQIRILHRHRSVGLRQTVNATYYLSWKMKNNRIFAQHGLRKLNMNDIKEGSKSRQMLIVH